MRVTGKIELIQIPGRTDRFVKKQIEHDYFLALKITDIDGAPITAAASSFEALNTSLPSIKVGDEEVNGLFETYKLAPGMMDVCHLSLAYFGDFRVGRNTDNDLDQDLVDLAYEELDGQEVSFEIEDCPFQVVSTSKQYENLRTDADVAYASVVGAGRDTILNILPSKSTQDLFTRKLSPVFGEGFQLWNSQKKPVPFHVTIAQTDKLNAKLAALQVEETKVDAVTLSV